MQTRYLIVLGEDGKLQGASVTNAAGSPVPLDPAALAAAVPGIDAAALARVAELEAELEEARRAPAAEPPSTALDALSEAFDALPLEIQSAFAESFATVRTLVQANRPDLAASHVAKLVVPPETEPVRERIIALLGFPDASD